MAMPFKRLPKRFVIEMVERVTILVNSIPRADGVHDAILARQLVTGKILRIPACKIREYAHGHVPTTNDTGKPRPVEGLYLGPADNGTGYHIFKLSTKEPIKVPRVTPAPITDSIIDLVNEMAEEEGQPEGIQFWDLFGQVTINDIELGNDREGMLDDDDSRNDDSNALDKTFELNKKEVEEEYERDRVLDKAEEKIDGDDELQFDHFRADDDMDSSLDGALDDTVECGVESEDSEDDSDSASESDPSDNADLSYVDDDADTDCLDDDGTNNENDNDIPVAVGEGTRPGMQGEIESDLDNYWGDNIAGEMLESEDKAAKMLSEYSGMSASLATPQYGFKKGLKLFGNAGYDAMVKELKENLVRRNCIKILNKNEVTSEIRKSALGYLLFLKQKRCGKIKGRGCVDGRPQRAYITKEQSTTSTISLHALMATCLIDALVGREVMTVDVPGAFLQVELEDGEDYHVRFTGQMVEMLCRIDASYREKIIYDR